MLFSPEYRASHPIVYHAPLSKSNFETLGLLKDATPVTFFSFVLECHFHSLTSTILPVNGTLVVADPVLNVAQNSVYVRGKRAVPRGLVLFFPLFLFHLSEYR